MKVIIFDLDYTLYDPKQYFFGAFREICKKFSKNKILRERMFDFLVKRWREKTSMYPSLFDDFLNKFNLDVETREIVKIFNEYDGPLKPFPETIEVLERLKRKGVRLGVLTDGNPLRQERKIKLLGIKKFFDEIIFVKNTKYSKKNKNLFLNISKKFSSLPKECSYVGDNPLLDFSGASKAGMKTVRIKKGEFRKIVSGPDVYFEVKDLNSIVEIFRYG
jgi:putative hydrolase of the HAD superfamily